MKTDAQTRRSDEYALEQRVTVTTITLKRYQFDRAIKHLTMIEGLALIRAAYGASLATAKEIRADILKQDY